MTPRVPARVRAVLFDIDGTLLDSNDAHAHAWLDALRGHGVDLPFEHIRSAIGMGGDKLLRTVADIDPESDLGRSIASSRAAIVKSHYLADMAPLPGARALVDRIRARGLLCAAVTSATQDEARELLVAAGVADLIGTVITADDADRTKPDPDSVGAALEKLDVGPEEAIMIGDTPYDVAACRRAGVGIIALRSGGRTDRELFGAAAIYEDAAELSMHLESSPILRRTSPRETPPPLSRGTRRPSPRP